MSFFEVHDPAFRGFVMGNAPVKRAGPRVSTGWKVRSGSEIRGLLFSDIPNNRILRWTEEGVTTFRAPSNYANGHTRDREGRLVSCEHGTRRVTRTELDGRVTVLADSHEGKRFNSPNDVIVSRDGAVWFSDPHYGIKTDYEGFKPRKSCPGRSIASIRRDGGGVISDMQCPQRSLLLARRDAALRGGYGADVHRRSAAYPGL